MANLIYTLGIINLVFMFLVLITCRCIPVISGATKNLFKYKWYQKLYRAHCIIWIFFIVSVFFYTMVGFGVLNV